MKNMSLSETNQAGFARRHSSIGATLFSLALSLLAAVQAFAADTPANKTQVEKTAALAPYTEFIKNHRQPAADYIIGLFDKYDVVILSERVHPEVTQYDLVLEVIRDPRFVQKVGHVFTEVGTSTLGPKVDALLLHGRLPEEEILSSLRQVFLNIGHSVAWDKANYYDFLRRVHDLNATLAEPDKIHLFPSDMPFSWDGMTSEKMAEFRKTIQTRDRVIADQIVERLNNIRQSDNPRKKALVIMNYRHAMPHMEMSRGGRTQKIKNVAGFLMDAWPGRVANVMLNATALLPDSSDSKASITALQDGKWDAAFAVAGNPNIGFDFAGSPFGADSFDYWPFPTAHRYFDRFTGFVFWRPLSEHRMVTGVPDLMDEPTAELTAQRLAISKGAEPTSDSIRKTVNALRTRKESDYTDKRVFKDSSLTERINQWLPAPATTPR